MISTAERQHNHAYMDMKAIVRIADNEWKNIFRNESA